MRGINCLVGVLALLVVAAVQDDVRPLQQDSPPQSVAAADAADIRSLGAVGDGRADDTDALQAAVDAGIGCIRLTKGVYRLTRSIVVELDRVGYTSFAGDGVATIVMAGPGPAIRFVGTHFKSADPEGYEQKVWDRQRMPAVDGLAILGDHPEAVGIAATGTMQLTITRAHLRKLLHGIHLTENNRNVTFSDCHIYENRGVGIYYDDVNLHQSNITACHISYNDGGGIVSRKGNVRNIHVTGCDIESNMSPDTPPTANVLIDCRESDYGTGEVAITGSTIQHNNPSPGSANIRILGATRPREGEDEPKREGNVTITGNVLSDVKVNVHLANCRGVVLTGNTFWQGYEHNLLVEDCHSVVVGPNNFDRNPRYDYGNTQAANNGLVFRNCEDSSLSGLHVTSVWRSPAGLVLENCRRMNVTGSTILDCDNAGVLLKDVSDSRISDLLIRDDRPDASSVSIRAEGGENTAISDCSLGSPPQVDAGTTIQGAR